MSEPVEKGQYRRGTGMRRAEVFWIYGPHPTRPGFWVVVTSEFSYSPEVWGRREILERMPETVDYAKYSGGEDHPGERYHNQLMAAIKRDQ